MKSLERALKPFANIYVIVLCWILSVVNLNLFMKPLNDFAKATGLPKAPDVLDVYTYYTPEEGYQALATLGEQGRDAYRLANYTDFVLPILLFLSFALPYVALRKSSAYLVLALIYLIFDYIENVAEKYVLEIFPERNDTVMTLACYTGFIKIVSFVGNVVVLLIDGLRWLLKFFDRSANNSRAAKIR